MDEWYRCSVCFESLFKAECVIGSMGISHKDQHSRRFLIIDWTDTELTNLHYSTDYYTKNQIPQYSVLCPICRMYLIAPVQMCLGVARIFFNDLRDLPHYKRSVKRFSKTYQLIRSFLIEPPYSDNKSLNEKRCRFA